MKEIKEFDNFSGTDGYVIVDGLTSADAGGKKLLSTIGGGDSILYTVNTGNISPSAYYNWEWPDAEEAFNNISSGKDIVIRVSDPNYSDVYTYFHLSNGYGTPPQYDTTYTFNAVDDSSTRSIKVGYHTEDTKYYWSIDNNWRNQCEPQIIKISQIPTTIDDLTRNNPQYISTLISNMLFNFPMTAIPCLNIHDSNWAYQMYMYDSSKANDFMRFKTADGTKCLEATYDSSTDNWTWAEVNNS